MPTKAELIKYIKAYKKKNCPPYSNLKKAELQKVAEEMGYGKEPEKEREVKISGGDVLQRIRDLTEASKSRMEKRSEKKQSQPRRPTPKRPTPKKSKEELINELKARRKQLFKEFIENGKKISELPESRLKEGKQLLKRNQKIQTALKKISEAFKKIKAQTS